MTRALVLVALSLWLAGAGRNAFDRWVDATLLPPLAVETGVEVRAHDGRLLRVWQVADGRWRLAVAPDAVDPLFLSMLLAYEDRRFHRHDGVDPAALLRAAWQALRAGRPVSGGSTLTMQVARLLEQGGTGRIAGKLRQIRVALALERRLDKTAVLSLYLRLAPYGGNVEGVRAASLSWFGREPRRLTPAQAALLVALPQAPEARRPDRDPAAARLGRDRVLARAAAAGLIDADTLGSARQEPVPEERLPFPRLAPHLSEALRAADPMRAVHHTTLDAAHQSALEALAAEAVGSGDARLQAAFLVADHRTGSVLAYAGSSAWQADARQGFVDMVRAIRSPGSTLKPLVYALAFDDGLAHPETLIEDAPVAFGTYAPQNFDRRFRGTLRLRHALAQSLNIPVVLLTEALGPERLMLALRRAGLRPGLAGGGRAGLAVALGGIGLSLWDLVQLYAGLAQGGTAPGLHATVAPTAGGGRMVGPVAAWQVGQILAEIPPPPGTGARPLAYKTGTSYGHRDAWAIGFDGRHVAGVWMGRADGTPVPGAFGADLAAPLLFRTFDRLGLPAIPLPPPPPDALIQATAALPAGLQRFRRGAGRIADDPGIAIAFPPDGAALALDDPALQVRVEGGTAPFVWLADGAPVLTGSRLREAELPLAAGPVTLSVIDAAGRAARVRVVIEP